MSGRPVDGLVPGERHPRGVDHRAAAWYRRIGTEVVPVGAREAEVIP